MGIKLSKLSMEFIGKNKVEGTLKTGKTEGKKRKIDESGIIRITYELDKKIMEEDQYIQLFTADFVEKNKKKCKIIINGEKYEIISEIKVNEFEKYGIKEEDEKLEVILLIEKEIDDMSYIFYDCKSLIKADLSLFNAKNVKYMNNMFNDCKSLIKVDLSSLNIENVEDMGYMFCGCKSLIKVDSSSFKTENVEDMGYMFSDCESLVKVDLPSFDIQNDTDMDGIFWGCKNLIKVNIKRKKFHKIKYRLDLEEPQLSIIEV